MKKAINNTYQINGRVIDNQSRRGIAGLRVEAWDKDLIISDLVGSDRTDEEGKFRIEFSRSYFSELFLDRKPDLFFKVFADDELIKSTQDSILWNVPAGTTPVEIVVSFITPHEVSGNGHGSLSDDGGYTVSGIVASPDRAGVSGLRVELVDKNVGQDIALGETNTDERGRYKLSFSSTSLRKREKTHPDLQARVFANGMFIGASEIRYNANHEERLNVALPANSTALGSEHETLVSALATHFTGKLRDLKESAEHQDITYLANKTGWDARAVALAALADQFSRHSTDEQDKPSIAPAFYYALFRAGLPANPDTLYRANVQTVKAVWQKAVEQGVIAGATSQEVEAAAKSFQKLSAEKLLTAPALTGASSLKALLDVSRLNETEQTKFAELYTEHRQDRQEFWTAIKNEFGEKTADRLQVNGKLSFVTLNNAPLISALHTAAGTDGVSDPVQLAQNGLHRPTAWLGLLDDAVAIPNEIPGDNPQTKRTNYAEYLAAQVRISYPTASVAEMVGSGDLAVKARDNVHGFLSEHQGEFEIGTMPVEQYVARKNLTVSKETLTEVKQIQRVYQITPSDQAMNALMKRGVHAAAEVVRFDKQTFIETFAKEMGGGEIAAHTYDRSLQVHNAVLNIAMSYIGARNGVEVGSQPMQSRGTGVEEAGNRLGEGLILSPQPKLRGGGENVESDVIAYPTLEELFGEMDFCACDHCRSILSPAAYLVDLLLFIDQTPSELEPGKENALTVFRERRPDIENLPLTCENTNTALPYIDVVNETLEYFIANAVQRLSLQGYLGHDTGQTASEDLLASPQFVMDSAYTTLRNQPFPTLLPFHQSLENLRRHFDKFEVPLPLAMERLRKNDQLERGTNEYGWRDILMEQLRLSRDEHEILTSAGANPLWQIYGMVSGTSNADAVIALSNAKQFSRRLGITYEDVVEILKTRFVNPNSDLVPKLERLGVPFAALQALKDGTLSDADFDDMLPTGAGAPDPAQYDGDIKAWVREQENFDRIMTIITLADPSAKPDPCNFDKLEFRFAKPMANPDDTSTRLGDVEFVRLLRFIRLWKKLGWTIEQTDTAICALFPVPPFPLGEDAIDTTAKLDAGFRLLLHGLVSSCAS